VDSLLHTPPLSIRIRRDLVSGRGNRQLSRPRRHGDGVAARHTAAQTRRELAEASLAKNTRYAYASDLKQFIKWGGRIPCSAAAVESYLMHRAYDLSVATLCRRVMAIRNAHVERGLRSPTDDPEVKKVLRGIRRQFGVAQKQAKPLTRKLLRRIVRSMDHSPIDRRDRALLLLGFAGGFRRSELVALDVEDLEPTEEGLMVRIKRSKTDQEQRGRLVAIPLLGGRLCPVTALEKWLKSARIKAGPIFRSFDRGGGLTALRLDGGYVSQVVKDRLEALGIDPKSYSAHSLRAGLVTEAARAGVPSWKIRQQTGHRSEATLARYVRDAELWQNNSALAAFGRRHGIRRRERTR